MLRVVVLIACEVLLLGPADSHGQVVVDCLFSDERQEELFLIESCAQLQSLQAFWELTGSSGAVWGREHYEDSWIRLSNDMDLKVFCEMENDSLVFHVESGQREKEGACYQDEETGKRIQNMAQGTEINETEPLRVLGHLDCFQALEQDSSTLGSDSSRILIGMVVDANRRLVLQAFTLLRSLRLFGGKLNEATVLIVVTPAVPGPVRDEFRNMGAIVREAAGSITDVIPGATPHCNKLLLFQEKEVSDQARFDQVLYLDCDILFVNDVSKTLLRGTDKLLYRSGAVTWADAIFGDTVWEKITSLAGVPSDVDLPQMYGFPNTGVISIPTWMVPVFYSSWFGFTDKIAFWIRDIIKPSKNVEDDLFFLDTMSFMFALDATSRSQGQISARLPVQLNTQLNWPLGDMSTNKFLSSLAHVGAGIVQHNQGTLQIYPNGTIIPFNEDQAAAFPFLVSLNKRVHIFNQLLGTCIG
mmetsp:Transcript_9482/g.15533  ORF Transcript_9482/g.15533 Transcript_9482/m.15533 type:complete len:471 (+) Transcript_9482:160-1572(+)|eukprot:CAMPEP_0203761930 /NCGR_PEP_ID=MMETSP0098-20131031/14918_1 /ASSEMBLY_ACC=CAM_ASM_000208 /TAXON_ID=96639 /ORGANISM=" , Strain NY0313808BC1" /LENGTH=470 /DNA_ID=CAMNT_0050656127 /DNA_START=306 /DNA_END=1718 /DNA_ORIENTATION=+